MNKVSAPLTFAGISILMAGQLLPLIDFSIVNVALDAIAAALHASHVELELMVSVYGVAFAVCLAMGGRLGDNFGRRRIFTLGVWLFGFASLGCGLSTSILMLLVARALQGVAAALIVPQILATIHVCLSGRAHSRALGLYGSVGGLAFIVGQVLGGWLVSADIAGLGWRSVFLINIPVCIVIILFCSRWVPETWKDQAASVDWSGTLILAATIICLLIPVALGPVFHWAWPYVLMLLLVVPFSMLFWHTEQAQQKKGVSPLMPPRLLKLASVQFGLVLAVLFFSCWSGFMFAVALTLQSGLGMSASYSGNSFVALGFAYFIGSLISARVTAKIGHVRTLLTGCTIQMCGLTGLIWTINAVWPDLTIAALIPATCLIGFGQSFIVSSFFRIGLSEVPANDAGSGSAILTTVQQAAFGLGSALLGSLFYQVYQSTHRYHDAVIGALCGELLLMSMVVFGALIYSNRNKAKREIAVD